MCNLRESYARQWRIPLKTEEGKKKAVSMERSTADENGLA